ncbi:hypothetical protein EBT31_22990, partial [bacterium]|nr:hypothetical protein [bacterium]
MKADSHLSRLTFDGLEDAVTARFALDDADLLSVRWLLTESKDRPKSVRVSRSEWARHCAGEATRVWAELQERAQWAGYIQLRSLKGGEEVGEQDQLPTGLSDKAAAAIAHSAQSTQTAELIRLLRADREASAKEFIATVEANTKIATAETKVIPAILKIQTEYIESLLLRISDLEHKLKKARKKLKAAGDTALSHELLRTALKEPQSVGTLIGVVFGGLAKLRRAWVSQTSPTSQNTQTSQTSQNPQTSPTSQTSESQGESAATKQSSLAALAAAINRGE